MPELKLTITDCDYAGFAQLSNWVRMIARVSAANPQFRGGTYVDQLEVNCDSKDVADALTKWEDPTEQRKIEIQECTLQTIKARLVPR